MNEIKNEALFCIVGSAHGVYSFNALVERNLGELYAETGNGMVEFKDFVARYCDECESHGDMEKHIWIFHPDNDEWCENIEWIENSHPLHVKIGDDFWPIQSIDGDIFAINPLAEYIDSTDSYVLPSLTLERLKSGMIESIECGEDIALKIIASDGSLEFGIESIDLPGEDNNKLLYTNTGDSYSEALCSTDNGETWFLSTWADVVEAAERDHYEETGETNCCHCGETRECEDTTNKSGNCSGMLCVDCVEL